MPPAAKVSPEGPPTPSGLIAPAEPGPVPEEFRHGGWRELLQNRRYVLLLAVQLFSGAGYAVYSVSVLFLAYGLTGNLLVAGAVLFVEYGVYSGTFLFAPIVDRVRDKRRILLACFPVQAAAAVTLALALRTGTLSIALLLGLVFLLAVLWDFDWVVFMIAPPIVVPKRQLFVADGFSSVVAVGMQVGGYAGGGALVFLVGPFGGASAYAVLLVAAAAGTIPLALRVEASPRTAFWETFRRGWALFRGRAGRPLLQLGLLDIWVGFFTAVPPLLITAIAYQRFTDPSAVYGPLVTAYAVGGSAAGIWIGHLNPRRYVGLLVVLTPLIAGVCLFALSPSFESVVFAALLLAGVGAALSVRFTAKYTWLQGSYPPELLGRLSANLYLFTGVSASISVLLVGLISVGVSLPTLLVLDGAGLIAGGILAFTLPQLRRLAF
jgi:hypothetical protein